MCFANRDFVWGALIKLCLSEVIVQDQQLLHELEVWVAEVRPCVQELEIPSVNHLENGTRDKTLDLSYWVWKRWSKKTSSKILRDISNFLYKRRQSWTMYNACKYYTCTWLTTIGKGTTILGYPIVEEEVGTPPFLLSTRLVPVYVCACVCVCVNSNNK